MANTLLLDTVTWDLCVDANGNIAMATEPYALAQDSASACRLFQGELWYDTRQGVPYWQAILGQMPPLAYLRAQYTAAAMLVPDVKTAAVFIASITRDRIVSGQVQVTGPGKQTAAASFGSFLLGVQAPGYGAVGSVIPPQPAPAAFPPSVPLAGTPFTLDQSSLDGTNVLL